VWQDILQRNPGASFFLTPDYAEIAERTLGTPAVCFTFLCEDGARAAVPTFEKNAGWLRRDLACPGGGLPGGILCDAPLDRARTDGILKALAQIPNAAFHLSFEPRDAPCVSASAERTARRERFFVLDLSDDYADLEYRSFAKDFREQCRKSARRGIRVAFEAGRGPFVEFGNLHRRASKSWDAASRKPLAFFAACADVAERTPAVIHLALARSEQHEGAAVAGLLLVRRGDTVTCWLAAMNRAASRLAPSAAVYRHGIEWACDQGATRLLLGASGGIASIEAFKRSMGADAIECVTSLEVRGTAREWMRRTRAIASVRPSAGV
jgi:CelD/BcsL family acetyltransferase involved in cellulose biosynthesis